MPTTEPGMASCLWWPLLSLLSLPPDCSQLFHVSSGLAELWGHQRSSAALPWGPGPAWSLYQLTCFLSLCACFAQLSICPAYKGSWCFKQLFAPQAALLSQQSI